MSGSSGEEREEGEVEEEDQEEEEEADEEEEEEEEEKWIPFSQRPEWADVTPVPQNDGPHPVVPILYSTQFRETMDYFRAMLAMDERSPRALLITQEVIRLNAGNYTVWHYRRLVLQDLSCDLWEELEFVAKIAESNYKNYQIWHHRRWTAEKLGSPALATELQFTEKVFLNDAKNYHAWSHRQWVLRAFGGWEGELDFCDQLLQQDVYNNSAWNQRYFVVKNRPNLGGVRSMREAEVGYAKDAITVDALNESPWRYLKGLFKGEDEELVKSEAVSDIILQELNKNRDCIFALDLLLDLITLGYEPSPQLMMSLGLDKGSSGSASDLHGFVCTRLKLIDPMRSLYWDWRQEGFASI